MSVKDRSELVRALDRTESALRKATADLEQTRDSVLELVDRSPGITVAELARRCHLSEEAVVAFAQTVGGLLGEQHSLSVEAARRGALLAAAHEAWEGELGPLLDTTAVRELLGVSRQRVDELLRSERLIALPDGAGRRRYPVFQFHEGRPLALLIGAFWTIARATISPWTAASWCTASDRDALQGLSPVQWARNGHDADHLAAVARQDAARLGR